MVHEWLRSELRARGLKNKALGDHLGWDDSVTSKVMKGSRQITAPELLRALAFLGYSTPLDEQSTALQRIVIVASKVDEKQRLALAEYLEKLAGQ